MYRTTIDLAPAALIAAGLPKRSGVMRDERSSTGRIDTPPRVRKAPDPEPMPREEFGRLLNLLLEAERAGARLLGAYLDELPPGTGDWVGLHAVQRDEARNCAVLIHYLLEADVAPSTATGDFYRKGLETRSWRERLEFLNRGQRLGGKTHCSGIAAHFPIRRKKGIAGDA